MSVPVPIHESDRELFDSIVSRVTARATDMSLDLLTVGDASVMLDAASAHLHGTRIAHAYHDRLLPADLQLEVREIAGEIAVEREVEAEAWEAHRDRWRAGETDYGWPDVSDAENERRHAGQIDRCRRLAAAAGELVELIDLAFRGEVRP